MDADRNFRLPENFFIYDLMADKGQKTSVNNTLRVYVDWKANVHAASTGVDINTLGEAKDWKNSDCNWQLQYDINSCGVLVLLAVFRAVDYFMSCDSFYHVIADKWICSMVKEAIAVYRKEAFHLLADVEDRYGSYSNPKSCLSETWRWKKVYRISLLPPFPYPCTND